MSLVDAPRRRSLITALLIGGLAVVAALAAVRLVGDGDDGSAVPRAERGATDFSARFAGYEPASEPDADPAKVVWPAFVTEAGPEVKRLYEFQLTNGELMRYMPCFCGCGQNAGHRNNRDCYVRRVNSDGSVVLDAMAPTWDICLGVTRDVMQMKRQGVSPREIRAAVDAKYADQIELATPTPYPPA